MKQDFTNQVSSFNAKTHFSNLLQRVKDGERITILKHNCPIAMLTPIPVTHSRDTSEVIQDLINFRKGKELSGIQLKSLIEEGRK